MKYDKCWTKAEVESYFTTESREKDKQRFERTHVKIDKVKVEISKSLPESKKFVSEEEVKDLILASRPSDSNRIFLLVGETGSGKSELCQWLDYNISDGIHVPIHISRSDTKLIQIAEILNRHLPEGTTREEDYGDLAGVDVNDLAELLVAAVKVRLKGMRDKHDAEVLRAMVSDDYFKKKLAREAYLYQQSLATTGKERQFQVFQKDSFERMPKAGDLANKSDAYHFVSRSINAELKQYLKVGDFGGKLKRISERYAKSDKRPVLLLEDVTSFSFLAEEILDYLFDIAGGHFDALLGWTTGFEREHSDFLFKADNPLTYIGERVQARFRMTDDENSTFFLGNRYQEMAGRYLSAIKCGKCDICLSERNGLYPFNEASLERIYENMQENGASKRTPRIMLEFVMKKALLSDDPPWTSLSQNVYLKPLPSLVEPQFRTDKTLDEVVKWYGETTPDSLIVKNGFLSEFDLEFPQLQQGEADLILPLSPMAKKLQTVKVAGSQKQAAPAIDDELMADFQNWVQEGKTFLNRERLKDQVTDVVQLIGNPCEIKGQYSISSEGIPLEYRRGADPIPIFVEDSGDDTFESEYKLSVSRKDSEILELLMEDATGAADNLNSNQVFRLINWANGTTSEYNQRLRNHLKDVLGVSLETFVLVSKFFVSNLVRGDQSLTSGSIKASIPTPQDSDWPFSTRRESESAEELVKHQSVIEGLFHSLFMITGSICDLTAINHELQGMNLKKTVQILARIDATRVRDAFRLETTGGPVRFRDLVQAVKDYAVTLRDTQYVTSYETLHALLVAKEAQIPDSVGAKKLMKAVSTIEEACGHLGIPLKAEWSSLIDQLKNEDLDWDDLREQMSLSTDRPVECNDAFAYISLFRESATARQLPSYQALQYLTDISSDISRKVEEKRGTTTAGAPENFVLFEASYKRLSRAVSK
ncbi:MAG: hypothetical protein JRN15_06540 [Nitrososphaerota archaeon]|nr:hypothetical protein [Nitrososphaerota archaeon]